jgi:2-oxo-4-hydroxy-4-carboxy-5-ureidoimidazoline decarboxylase
MGVTVSLSSFNGLANAEAQRALLDCCASPVWAAACAESRPYQSIPEVLGAADSALAALSWDEIETAVAAHPRLGRPPAGDGQAGRWSCEEQAGLVVEAEQLAKELVAYEESFGRVFLVDAHGLDAEAIADRLRRRLDNSPAEEFAEVRRELRGIVRRRIARMLI